MTQGQTFGAMDGVDGVDGVDGFEGLDLLSGVGRPSGVLRPVGIAPEFTRRPGETEYRGHRWPPRLPNRTWPPGPAGAWPMGTDRGPRLADFTPANASLRVVAEFVQQSAQDASGQVYDWARLMTRDPNNANKDDMAKDIAGHGGVAAELAELRQLAQFRPSAQAELLAQRNGIIGYYRGLLHFDMASHPYTYYLAAAALRVGQFLCMYYKGIFNRPRPNRLDPSLLPNIDPPGHPAYPSGHSLQSFLIARCLEQVVPAAVGVGLPDRHSPYYLLAERIAKLREVAGVHYPSDTAAGQRVADSAFPLLLSCPLVAGTMIDANGDGQADNLLTQVRGVDIYDNGWFAIARAEWQPL